MINFCLSIIFKKNLNKFEYILYENVINMGAKERRFIGKRIYN